MSKKLKLIIRGDIITIASSSGTVTIHKGDTFMTGDINSIIDVINIQVDEAYFGSGEDRDVNITN